MKTCKDCKTKNIESANYYKHCGSLLNFLKCNCCGYDRNELDAVYCISCGNKLKFIRSSK